MLAPLAYYIEEIGNQMNWDSDEDGGNNEELYGKKREWEALRAVSELSGRIGVLDEVVHEPDPSQWERNSFPSIQLLI